MNKIKTFRHNSVKLNVDTSIFPPEVWLHRSWFYQLKTKLKVWFK